MGIQSVILHVANVARSAEFYRRHLRAEVVEQTGRGAILDLVTATLELVRLDGGRPATWQDEDASLGFRHLGVKVSDLDAIVATLDEDGVRFRSRPLDIVDVGVRNAFFFDPDGTVVEMVENHLQYHVVVDPEGVADERAMPGPSRPRFDHIGHTVDDLPAAIERYRAVGFQHIGTLSWPSMHLEFLRGDSTVIELFSIPRASIPNPPQDDSYGFAGIAVHPMPEGVAAVGTIGGARTLFADPDDLAIVARREQ